jgi:hypothetical protein
VRPEIGGRPIGPDVPVCVIAEAGMSELAECPLVGTTLDRELAAGEPFSPADPVAERVA